MKWSTLYPGPGKGRAGTTGSQLVRKLGCMKKLFTSIYVTYKTEKSNTTSLSFLIPLFDLI